jgi:hypothetical protein
MSLTTPEPSVPQKPLACQSAKFGIDVLRPDCLNALSQARPQRASTITRGDLLPVSSSSFASVRTYIASPGFAPERPVCFVGLRRATEFAFRAAAWLR